MAHPLARPKWVVLGLIVLLLVVVMLNLGFWQLRRLDEKRDHNAEVSARTAEPVAAVSDVASAGDPVSSGDAVAFRRVTATGRYDLDGEALLRGRDLDGTPGFWVLTPLDLGDGTAVVVNRGWIPFEVETDGSDVAYDQPTGTVTVSGTLEVSSPGARPAGDERTTVAHADLDWFDEQLAADVYPVAIRLETQDPPVVGDRPVPVDLPALDEGPHLSYAIQWFLFSAVALIGFPLLLRHQAQEAGRRAAAPEAAPPPGDDEPPHAPAAVSAAASAAPVPGPADPG